MRKEKSVPGIGFRSARAGSPVPGFGRTAMNADRARAHRTRASVLVVIALVALGPTAFACDLKWRFAGPEEGGRRLAAEDAYLRIMSPADRALRMKSTLPVSPSQYRRFFEHDARAWRASEIQRIQRITRDIDARLKDRQVPLPDEVVLIKTSGREDARAAFHRGNAIVLPQAVVDAPDPELEQIVAHELFHVVSEATPALRARLYPLVGFARCSALHLPADLERRRITNPDAPLLDACMHLDDDANTAVFPVLLAKRDTFDPRVGTQLLDYVDFELVAAHRDDGVWRPRAHAFLLDLSQVPAYVARTGGNTAYVIHPEEIWADNFVLWLFGAGPSVRSPQLLTRLGDVLASLTSAPCRTPRPAAH